MKNLLIKAYRDNRGPMFILTVPIPDELRRRTVEQAIDEVVSKMISICMESPDKPHLKVDLKIRYDSDYYKYSFCVSDDQKLSTLKNELLSHETLRNAGIQQIALKQTL